VVRADSLSSNRRFVVAAAGVVLGAWLMVQGLGPEHHAWFGWAALLPLFIAIRILGPRGAMACGGLWGACVYLFSTLLPTLMSGIAGATTSPTPSVIQPGLLSLLLLAAAPAIYAWLAAHYTRWYTFDPLGLGVGWAGVEFALMPLGLHNGLVGQTIEGGVLFDVVGRFLGYVLVALIVAFTAAVIGAAAVDFIRCNVAAARVWTRGAVFSNQGLIWLKNEFIVLPLIYSPQACPRAPPA